MINKNIYSVYVHTAPNGKVYVGMTSRPPRVRWNYGHGYRCSPFYEAVREYGWNNISHEVVATNLNEDDAYTLEIKLISKYDSTNPEKGYNCATGGRGTWGVKISEETRQRLVESHLDKKNPHTEEWNRKISEANKGKRKPHVGVPRSKECIQRIREKHSKPVLQYDRGFVFIKEYSSIREAEKQTGVRNQNISSCCLGKAKTAGGYIWKYKNKSEDK